MTITYFPFDGVNVFEAQWELMARLWLSTGVMNTGRSNIDLNKFEAFGDNSGLQVKVKSGTAWIEGFYVSSSAEEIVTLSTADATNPRIDRIILKLDRGANTITLTKLTGTPAGSPTAPSLTQNSTIWEISLAQVYVAATVTLIAAEDVTDERPYAGPGDADAIFYSPSTVAYWNGGIDPGNVNDALDQLAARQAVVQEVYIQTGEVATGTTTIPIDDTIPQNTEGTQLMTLAITPTNASNRLLIEAIVHLSPSVNAYVTTALFKDSEANALAAMFHAQNANTQNGQIVRHEMTAGSTSAMTFKIRAGLHTAGTITFNGEGGARKLGGVLASSIRIKEIKA